MENTKTEKKTTYVDANIIKLNEIEARLDYLESQVAVLMKDREAYIRWINGNMTNETGLLALINSWKNEA
jgi:hypothetical protein